MTTTDAERTTNWGRWGDSDERGTLNLVTDERVLAAAASVTRGKVYSLGIPIQASGVPLFDYRGTPMRLTLMNESDEGAYADFGCAPGTGSSEDVLVFASHTTSHIDALCHVYEDHHHYNGVPAAEVKTHTGAQRLGVEKIGAVVGRGVVLDVAKLKGADWLEPGATVTAADLEACEQAGGFEVGAGDIALIRTGYLDFWFANNPNIPFEQPGIGMEAARWLGERDVLAVGCDNSAVEVIPFDGGDFLSVHKELLVRRGTYLAEHLLLSELSGDNVTVGLCAISPLKVTGATGSPVNPVFIA